MPRPLRRSISETKTSGGKPYWEGSLVVSEVIDEAIGIRTFRLKDPAGQTVFPFTGGQYLDISVELGGQLVRRSYSISSSDQVRQYIDITVKREPHGMMSGYLFDEVGAGMRLNVRGPLGQFTAEEARYERLVLIGAGVGVTPLMSIIRSLRDAESTRSVTALFGFRNADYGLFTDELALLSAQSDWLDLTTAWSRPQGAEEGHKGRLDLALVKRVVKQPKKASYFVCGPDAMMGMVRDGLERTGVHSNDVHEEAFSAGPADLSLGGEHSITFGQGGMPVQSEYGETLLDVGLRAGMPLDYSCRTGTCGLCVAQLLRGRVDHHKDDGLEDEDLERGRILSCQAYPLADCDLDFVD
ncbi:MAG: FAD-binding oxidoreductase [Pseudomonadota bacterium]